MPFPMEAEAIQVEEEARSVLGTLIAQIIGIVRACINLALGVVRQLITWSGEHPQALVLGVANLCIWMA